MGETSSSSHSRQDPYALGYGFHGAIANSTPNFFDQEGGTYFGELEEAFMRQVASLRRTQAATTSTAHHGDATPFSTATARPPPTLDIFPAWPMRSLHTPKVWTCYKCRVPLAGTCRSKNTSLQLPPICFCTLEGLNFGGRQHRRVGEQQQEQQQPLLRPPRSNRKHGKPVRSRFTATRGDSAQEHGYKFHYKVWQDS